VLRKYNYLNQREFYKEQARQTKQDELQQQEQRRRHDVERQTEEEMLQRLKDRERQKQVQEAWVRHRHREFKDKIKAILKAQEQAIDERKAHLELLHKERE